MSSPENAFVAHILVKSGGIGIPIGSPLCILTHEKENIASFSMEDLVWQKEEQDSVAIPSLVEAIQQLKNLSEEHQDQVEAWKETSDAELMHIFNLSLDESTNTFHQSQFQLLIENLLANKVH